MKALRVEHEETSTYMVLALASDVVFIRQVNVKIPIQHKQEHIATVKDAHREILEIRLPA